MNERIKQLADEHFCRIEYDSGYVHECYEFSEQELEKFAELIVRECMHHVTWVGKVNTAPVEPIHTTHAINLRISKNFGVE